MEGSPAKHSPADNAGDSPTLEKRIVCRRFVQSTLFPQKQAEKREENPDRGEAKDCERVDDEGGGGDELCCGSEGRRKRKQTPKSKSQPRSLKKVAQDGKVALAAVTVDDCSPEGSPQKLKEKQCVLARNGRTSGIKVTCLGRPPTHTTVNHLVSQPIPDLRLEAKMTAEVDSQRFAGRKLHPFFSSLKVVKKNQETDNGESRWNLTESKFKNFECGPIHVFENVKDGISSIDWSNWTFSDGIFSNTSCSGNHRASVYEGFVGCLRFDKIGDASKLLREPTYNHRSKLYEEVGHLRMTDSLVQIHDVAESCQLLKDTGADHLLAQISIASESDGCLRADLEQDNLTPSESLFPYCINRENQPKNSLWIVKYQPEKTCEVCGNAESVKVLSEWLSSWREIDLRSNKKIYNADKCSVLEDDYDPYNSEYGEENLDETFGLGNVLLVKGPVGSGKSAAIYACAKEQGFEVIEVNASDWRSGALVKQKFGEAVGLHWLKRTQESPMVSRKLKMKSSLAVSTSGAVGNESNGDVTQVLPLSDDEAANGAVELSQNSVCSVNSDQGEIKTLILFEDVDANLNEDRGFVSTIQQLAHMAKRPMILTTNSHTPALPDNLDRQEVCFVKPLQNELLSHVAMVFNAEKADNDPCMIEKYIQYCKGDIRKTLMHLQFWCQGKEYNRGDKVLQKYSPLMFNVEAGHHILPKIIPWGFSSKLSEYIEMEITKSVCRMEENPAIFPWDEEMKNDSVQDRLVFHIGETASAEAKKEVLLSRNAADDGHYLMAPVINTSDVTDCSGSPIAFIRRNSGKKFGVVLSDSDDDIYKDEPPGKLQNLCNDNIVCGVDSRFPINYPGVDSLLNPCSPRGLVGFWHQYSGTENVGNNNELCLSASGYNISCVPESTCIPETELNSKMELSMKADTELSMDQPVLGPPEVSGATESAGYININSWDEEMGDSQKEIKVVETCSRRFQLLDECSRMDFCKGSKGLKKCCPQLTIETDPVQESWKDLRCRDLRQHLAAEHKDASEAVNLAYKLCNLLSVSDLLLCDCGILTDELASQETNLIDDNFTFGWHDHQVEMTSAISEHGYCVFAKDAISLGSRIGLDDRVNIAWEMIASTSNSIALGKLLRYDNGTSQVLSSGRRSNTVSDFTFERERKMNLQDVVHSIVPPRCYLSLRGDSLHDYLSSLAHIFQSEASRVSESAEKPTRRRCRVDKCYLSGGPLSLTPEDILVLCRYNRCAKFSSQSTETTQESEVKEHE